MIKEIDVENQRRIDIILSGQAALLGVITPALRVVQATWDEKTIALYFLYDGPVANESEVESKRVVAKLQQDLPQDAITATCLRVDYPKDFPKQEGANSTWLYARKERKP